MQKAGNLRIKLRFLPAFTHRLRGVSQQKTHFCLPTKVRFLNDVCLQQMMLASPMMTATPSDVCLTAHWANIASLKNSGELFSAVFYKFFDLFFCRFNFLLKFERRDANGTAAENNHLYLSV